MFSSFHQDVQNSGSSWVLQPSKSSSSSAEPGPGSLSALTEPLLGGLEVRHESERCLEFGLTKSLSLILRLLPHTAQHYAGSHPELTAFLQLALLHAESKFRSVQYLQQLALSKQADEPKMQPDIDNVMSTLSPFALTGRVAVNKESWPRFFELGSMNLNKGIVCRY